MAIRTDLLHPAFSKPPRKTRALGINAKLAPSLRAHTQQSRILRGHAECSSVEPYVGLIVVAQPIETASCRRSVSVPVRVDR